MRDKLREKQLERNLREIERKKEKDIGETIMETRQSRENVETERNESLLQLEKRMTIAILKNSALLAVDHQLYQL